MAMSGNPIARKLYLRIWLAVAGSVLVLSVLVGGAWHMAEQEREHDRQAGQPREVLVRDAAGELIGTAEAQPRRLPGQGLEFVVTLRDGQVLSLQLPPRSRGRAAAGGGPPRHGGAPPLAWLRPPFGFWWLLAPFRWVVAPMFATDTAGFLHALPAALAILLLHYAWALRAQVSFEDASIVHARKRAERTAAMREGRMGRRMPSKPRAEPFRLAGAGGHSWPAFLWKDLVAMGPLYRLRTWLLACVAATVLCQWLAADPARKAALVGIGIAVPAFGAWLVFFGPMLMQNGLRRTFERMDVLKALPLRGWQLALGELAAPAAVMCFAFWWLLLFGAQAIAAGHSVLTTMQIVAAAVALALVAPPLSALMLCVPFAGMLLFPAWIVAPGSSGRGIEVMGQRMVFMLGYLFTVLLAAIPAALLGGIGFLLGQWLGGMAVAMLAAALGACAVFAFELACALRLLGRRIDRFDLSQELR